MIVFGLAFLATLSQNTGSQALPHPPPQIQRDSFGVPHIVGSSWEDAFFQAGYAASNFSPRQWTPEDSVAISVRLFQLFGRGGADQLRNLALLAYLRSQPAAKGKELDIMDDLEWQNEPAAIPTLPKSEDPQM